MLYAYLVTFFIFRVYDVYILCILVFLESRRLFITFIGPFGSLFFLLLESTKRSKADNSKIRDSSLLSNEDVEFLKKDESKRLAATLFESFLVLSISFPKLAGEKY